MSKREPNITSGRLKPLTILFATLLVFAAGTAVWLVLRAIPPVPPKVSSSLTNAEMAAEIARQCSMGGKTETESSVTASLTKYLSGLSSGAKVSTSDVGAVIDKITPNDQGLAFYKAYTECLKQQAAIYIEKKGVNLTAASPVDPENAKDQDTLERVSEIKATTPKAKLNEIFGNPIYSGISENSEGFSVDMYQYKTMVFAADYYDSTGNRVGLVLATKEPEQGKTIRFDQIRNITIGSIDCGGFETTMHWNARSKACMASRASGDQALIYFFSGWPTMADALQASMPQQCNDWAGGQIDPKMCPGIAATPATGVAMVASGGYPDKTFEKVGEAFLSELDFGNTFSWRNLQEQKAMDQRDIALQSGSAEDQRKAEEAETERRRLAVKAFIAS